MLASIIVLLISCNVLGACGKESLSRDPGVATLEGGRGMGRACPAGEGSKPTKCRLSLGDSTMEDTIP